MSPKEPSEVTIETLLALRQNNDALRLITEKFRVKEMGPADHIRTKHGVKTFLETGDEKFAEELIKSVTGRLAVAHNETSTETISQKRGWRKTD